MLESIHIENIALIKSLDITFSDSFCAFTGETGAGKSIIIDSIGALCGARVSRELIRNGETSARVDAVFSSVGTKALAKLSELDLSVVEDGRLYISRTFTADGKNTVKINFRTFPLAVLRELSTVLINIHGQHDNQELLIKEKHRPILDSFAENSDILENYKKAFEEYCVLKREYDSINKDESENARRIETLQFQINEISALKIKQGDEDKLIEEKKLLSGIEKISKCVNTVYDNLNGSGNGISACECIDRALEALNSLAKVSDIADEYIDRLNAIRSELDDIGETLLDMADTPVSDPTAALDRIEQKLDGIARAKRKYGPAESDVIEYLEKAKSELSELQNSGKRSEELLGRMRISGEKLKKAAKLLTESRQNSAKLLEELIQKELEYLEMSKVVFKVQINTKPFSRDGADDIEFFVRTNSGQDFTPLCKTASGGELSRLMLAIKSVLAKKDGVDTLIFDEVDTGISGKTSRRIGVKLLQTAKYAQVLCVTHSAQIASLAKTHFLVSKFDDGDSTVTSVTALGEEQRIEETARIIAGINITDSAKKAARELIYNTSE